MRLKLNGELIVDKFGSGNWWIGVGGTITFCDCEYLVTELHNDGITIVEKPQEGAKE